ncbi:MAG: hypothetical protein OCC45_11480 [Desulfotalea sp.]
MNLEIALNIARYSLYIGTVLVAIGTISISFISSKLDQQKESKIDNLVAGNQNLQSSNKELHQKVDDYQKEQEHNQAKVLDVVAPNVELIISFFTEQFSTMAISGGKLGLQQVENPSREQMTEVLSQLDPKAQSIMASVQEKRHLNWLEYLNQYNQRTIILIDEIYKFMPFLDSELITLLGELKDCYHFKEIELVAQTGVENDNLAFIPLFEYKSKIDKLRDYYEDNLIGIGVKKIPFAVVPMAPNHYKK